VRVDRIDAPRAQQALHREPLHADEGRQQQVLPLRTPQVGRDAAAVDQRFQSRGRVAIADDLDAFDVARLRAIGMRHQRDHVEARRQALAEFVHETGFDVARPPRIGGRQDEDGRLRGGAARISHRGDRSAP
jgi:hypothetical protein